MIDFEVNSIAIIAILAAMLLPALNKARERAKAITCVGNMKQLGHGMLGYVDDYSRFVVYLRSSGGQTYIWPNVLSVLKYINYKTAICPGLKPDFGGTAAETNWNDLLAGKDTAVNQYDKEDYKGWQYIGYGYNWRFLGHKYFATGNTSSTASLSQITRPSTMLMFGDSAFGAGLRSRGSYTIDPRYVNRNYTGDAWSQHGNVNIAWVDGHVSSVGGPSSEASCAKLYTESGPLRGQDFNDNAWTRDGKPLAEQQ